jgi:hypothetical protein
MDFVRDLDACALGHRGVLLDFGDPSTSSFLYPGSLAHGDSEVVEHEGATWLRVRSRTLTASFTWPPGEPSDQNAYVEGRVRGLTARAVAIALDGRPIGSWTLARSEARIALARAATPVTLGSGGHELTMRFVGGPRAGDEPLAELDWVHVGTGEQGEPYAAPTRTDVVRQATAGSRSMPALSLRAPGFVRCSGWVPASATLEASLSTTGGGEAHVEARLLRDRRAPLVLGAARASASVTGWSPWVVPITGLDSPGGLASIELAVTSATKGTRLLVGDPRLVATGAGPIERPPPVRGVVLVVLGSTSAKSLAPWGGPLAAPELTRLAASGTTFLGNRAPTSLASAVVASMLTGLGARAHGVDDPGARLPRAPVTVQDACRQSGAATAMFTANPTTGGAFGFDRGWDTFVAHDPLETVPATRVFDDAAAWIDAHKGERFFVVVHARGGHPPWDVSPEEERALQPEGYLGLVEASRAAEILAKAHRHPGRFKDDDRVRAWALYDRAVEAHDEALGRLVQALATAGRREDTAIIVTADVAAAETPPVPFVDSDALEEPVLATPLVVRWPRAPWLGGRRVEGPTSSVDIARTVLASLQLEPPAAFQGVDLGRVASGAWDAWQRPLAATRGDRFTVRWGPLVLVGAGNRELRMCDLALDPTCVADVRATSPIALEPLHRRTLDLLTRGAVPAPARESAVFDEHTTEALVRWGELPDPTPEDR